MRKPVVPHMNNPPEALVECDASLRFFLPPFTCLSDFPASSSYEAYLQRNIEMLADFRTLGGRRRRSDRVVDPWIRNILPVS